MPRHDLDVLSLVAGVAFGGAALVFLVDSETRIATGLLGQRIRTAHDLVNRLVPGR